MTNKQIDRIIEMLNYVGFSGSVQNASQLVAEVAELQKALLALHKPELKEKEEKKKNQV